MDRTGAGRLLPMPGTPPLLLLVVVPLYLRRNPAQALSIHDDVDDEDDDDDL